METPNVPLSYVPVQAGESFKLGKITIRIMEDGSHTDNRIGSAEFLVPPNTPGKTNVGLRGLDLSHIGMKHDETFLVTQGTIRFHALSGKTIDCHAGDYMVVPTRSPHTFSNPTDQPAKFFNTYTPAFYINYFKMLAGLVEGGKPMTAEANRRAMAYFATIGVAEEEMRAPDEKNDKKEA